MKSLLIDFNNYNGHQMMLAGKEPFQRKELHELELNMLSDNAIHTLLPINWLEADGEISFHYKIEGCHLITHYLRTQQLTMKRYYSLLLSLTDALATCYEYMLRPDCCLIDEHVLYINEQQERMLLAYLPLHEPVYERQAQQLLLLAVRWSELVYDLDAKGYHRILQLLSAQDPPIIPLRQLLLDLIHEQTQHAIHLQHLNSGDRTAQHTIIREAGGKLETSAVAATTKAASFNLSQQKAAHELIDEQQPEQASNSIKHMQQTLRGERNEQSRSYQPHALVEFNSWRELDDSDEEDLYEDENSAHSLSWKHFALTIIVLLSIVLAWIKLYAVNQTMEQLLMCSGITAGLLALLGFMLLKPVKAAIAAGKQSKQDALVFATSEAGDPDATDRSSANEFHFTAHSASAAPSAYSIHSNPRINSSSDPKANNIVRSTIEQGNYKLQDYAGQGFTDQGENASGQASKEDQLSNHYLHGEKPADEPVHMLRRHDAQKERKGLSQQNQLATVKLDVEQATSMLHSAEPVLMRSMNGLEERISIDESHFLIGRAEAGVHYREAAKGVSRIHLELELNNGKLRVKDAGSRNGTFLNGQLMIAYKAYPLQKGDKLQLASREGPLYELVG